MEDPSGCCHVGGSVSKGEVVFCHHYGMGVLGTLILNHCGDSGLLSIFAVSVRGC